MNPPSTVNQLPKDVEERFKREFGLYDGYAIFMEGAGEDDDYPITNIEYELKKFLGNEIARARAEERARVGREFAVLVGFSTNPLQWLKDVDKYVHKLIDDSKE